MVLSVYCSLSTKSTSSLSSCLEQLLTDMQLTATVFSSLNLGQHPIVRHSHRADGTQGEERES